MSTIEKAIELAAREHAGETDKGGSPYIFHPLRLMFAVKTPFEKMAAVLHDVVEDTSVTLDDLRDEGFHPDVISAIEALTKRTGESRMEAAARAAANPIAIVVKLADVTDNMDLSRISEPTDRDFARLKEYFAVKKYLVDQYTAKNQLSQK
jgi:(p)ppGpp synthase/HD superfamily hydrolase